MKTLRSSKHKDGNINCEEKRAKIEHDKIFILPQSSKQLTLNECERSDNIILENMHHVHSNTCDCDEATPKRPLR